MGVDYLTGLMDFQDLSEEIHFHSELCPAPCLYMLFIDVDKFNRINYKFGHNVSNSVLRAIAMRIKSSVCLLGRSYRYGGDGFVVMLEEPNLTVPVNIAKSIKKSIAETSLISGKDINLTVSIGISCSRHSSVNKLVDSAYRAMEKAKIRGGNRIFVDLKLIR